jgi:hypothetical protein
MIKKIVAFFIVLMISKQVTAANYYINSRWGDDTHKGTDMDHPWKSLRNLEQRPFLPGDSILFAKGSTFTGGFVFKQSGTAGKPIVFGSYSAGAQVVLSHKRTELTEQFLKYGAGPAPSFTNPDWSALNGNIFRIEGNYVTIENLYFHDNTNPPGSNLKNKNVQKLGVIYFATGTHHNILKNCEFFHTPVAVKVKGMHNLITRNYMHDAADAMAYSWGPIAIMVVSKHNEISYNKVTNYGSYGGPYGSDGGVIELDGVDDDFNATNVNIHHNISINNHGFLEIAARNVDSIMVAYNLSDDRNQFIGGGSMKNVEVYNNTVIRTREPNVDRFIFWSFYPDGTAFNVRNNIFVLAHDLQVFGPYKKPVGHVRTALDQPHDHNIYYSPGNANLIGVAAGKGDKVADPLFVDAQNGNYRLKDNSPARGAGVKLGFTTDVNGNPVNKNKPSIGAYDL